MTDVGGAILFVTDEDFRSWSAAHPEGFILNVRSTFSASYSVLHRAKCHHISLEAYDPGSLTERGYRKVGADRVADLASWVAYRMPDAWGIGAVCKSCKPDHNETDLTASAPLPLPDQLHDARRRLIGTIVQRRGQSKFRQGLLKAYGGTCAITGCNAVEVLEAAHIVPYRGDHTNPVNNGLLLRADLHTLFDLLLIWVEDDFRLTVAQSLMDTPYWSFNGSFLKLPEHFDDQPSLAAIRWHRDQADVKRSA